MSATITTYSGVKFDILEPKAEDVNLADIAHALSNQCRFNGHVNRFYSVAEHSVIMSRLLDSKGLGLAALLHDAAEAYVGDMPHPLKHSDRVPGFIMAEDLILRAIAERYGLEFSQFQDDLLKSTDRRLCATEAAQLWPEQPDWAQEFKPIPVTIAGWDPEDAKARFLDRFKELTGDTAD